MRFYSNKIASMFLSCIFFTTLILVNSTSLMSKMKLKTKTASLTVNSVSLVFNDREIPIFENGAISSNLKLKEGETYKTKIVFSVYNEIISGLRYHEVISRKGVNVDKNSYMIGSYSPKENHVYETPSDELPKGMLSRGTYKNNLKIIDDDKNVHKDLEYSFTIEKDW